MSTLKILFPYNFTGYDKKALAFINQTFARLGEVEITIFNVYMPVAEIETSNDSVMARMKSNLNFLRQKLVEQENELKSIQNQLQKGLSTQTIRYVFRPRKKKGYRFGNHQHVRGRKFRDYHFKPQSQQNYQVFYRQRLQQGLDRPAGQNRLYRLLTGRFHGVQFKVGHVSANTNFSKEELP